MDTEEPTRAPVAETIGYDGMGAVIGAQWSMSDQIAHACADAYDGVGDPELIGVWTAEWCLRVDAHRTGVPYAGVDTLDHVDRECPVSSPTITVGEIVSFRAAWGESPIAQRIRADLDTRSIDDWVTDLLKGVSYVLG